MLFNCRKNGRADHEMFICYSCIDYFVYWLFFSTVLKPSDGIAGESGPSVGPVMSNIDTVERHKEPGYDFTHLVQVSPPILSVPNNINGRVTFTIDHGDQSYRVKTNNPNFLPSPATVAAYTPASRRSCLFPSEGRQQPVKYKLKCPPSSQFPGFL